VGDFIVLLNAGFSKARAFAFNLLSSLAAIIGGWSDISCSTSSRAGFRTCW
jgi:zinc transporter ZupT